MTAEYPTARPTDADALGAGVRLPPALVNLPWIDPHNHAHTLSWADRERYELAGCRAMVMIASGSHWTPYRPVRPADVRFLWDDALNRLTTIRRDHFFEARLAVGVQTRIRVADVESLVEAMDRYGALDEVVAVGEIGVTPTQHVHAWSADEQRRLVAQQMAVANRHHLPVILHTPSGTGRDDDRYRTGLNVPGYERNGSLDRAPVIDAEDPALEAVRMDVDAARDAGLPDERLVASHADPNNAPYLFEHTDCYLSYTIGHPWLTGTSARTVADAIEAYGPERIMVDTDCANVLRSDVLAIKRAVFELYRLGVDEDAIRRVVYENAREVFGVGE